MHQPARSPYVSVLLLMQSHNGVLGGTWPRDLGQRETVNPGPSGRAVLSCSCPKLCSGWLSTPGSVVLCSTTPGQLPGHGQETQPGSAPQVELLTLTSCSLCGTTSTPSSGLANIAIANNTIKPIHKDSTLKEKDTSSIFKLCSE